MTTTRIRIPVLVPPETALGMNAALLDGARIQPIMEFKSFESGTVRHRLWRESLAVEHRQAARKRFR